MHRLSSVTARALSEAMETAEEPGTPPETGTTLPPTV